jgi:hypothetical protein
VLGPVSEFAERNTDTPHRRYYLGGVGYGSRPVEALSECIPDKSAWCSVMATHAPVDVLKQLSPLLSGDTTLQDSSGAPLVEFPIHQDERLGSTCEESGPDPVSGECSTD